MQLSVRQYGILMEEAGFAWYYSLLVSLTVYTGAFQFVLTTLLSAICTQGLRALPFVLFRKERKMPQWMERLGKVLPSAIVAVLIVYCLRGARHDLSGSGIPGGIGVLAVAGSYRWKHNTLLSIVLGTAVYMLLIRIM